MPPLPFHPFPELPAVEVEPKRYIYDDTLLNYDLLQAESFRSGPPVPGGGGGGSGTNPPPPYIAPTVAIPGVPLLRVELFPVMPGMEKGVKLFSFNTKTNFLYRVEATTNLSNPAWTTIDEFVATSTNSTFTADDEGGNQFYRVHQASSLFTFPDWFDRIEQFMEFKVKTTVTSGTISWNLYADEEWSGGNTNTIVPGQVLRVYDPNYDPNDWPDTGLYDVGEWRLRVGVTTPTPPGISPPGMTYVDIRKKGKQRNPKGTYQGAFAHVYGIFSTSGNVQDDVDTDLQFCASAMFNACELVNMDGTGFWEPIDPTQIIANCGMSAARWTNLFKMVGNGPENRPTWLDYFHYMGHGDAQSISGGGGGITKKMLQNSALKTNGMTYVALDACNAGEKSFLKAWVGYDKPEPYATFLMWGRDPAFACGWNREKGVEFVTKRTRIDEHFWFWNDWYYDLVRRNQFGTMYKRYREALVFATHPGNDSPTHPNLADNPEAKGFVMVGCDDCRFDERPYYNGY